jgi:hypothetical protein
LILWVKNLEIGVAYEVFAQLGYVFSWLFVAVFSIWLPSVILLMVHTRAYDLSVIKEGAAHGMSPAVQSCLRA